MEPIHNKRIYTRPLRRSGRKPSVGKASPASQADSDAQGSNIVYKPVYTIERRSGRDRRDGKLVARKYLDMRCGRDRRRSNRLDIKV